MVLIGPESRYDDRHPLAKEVALLIEVSDSTLDRDRGVKLRSYARAKISQYWIVNIKARQIEVFTSPPTLPTSPYGSVRTFGADDAISAIIGDQSHFDVAVSDILTS